MLLYLYMQVSLAVASRLALVLGDWLSVSGDWLSVSFLYEYGSSLHIHWYCLKCLQLLDIYHQYGQSPKPPRHVSAHI